MDKQRKRELGMHRPITRRDFLNGIAVGTGGLLIGQSFPGARAKDSSANSSSEYYPPALTGMRGNHDGTFT